MSKNRVSSQSPAALSCRLQRKFLGPQFSDSSKLLGSSRLRHTGNWCTADGWCEETGLWTSLFIAIVVTITVVETSIYLACIVYWSI